MIKGAYDTCFQSGEMSVLTNSATNLNNSALFFEFFMTFFPISGDWCVRDDMVSSAITLTVPSNILMLFTK